MPVTKAVVPGNSEPPVEAVYHCMAAPVTLMLARVGLLIEQNACGIVPVGAAGSAIVTATANLLALSHPFNVWLA